MIKPNRLLASLLSEAINAQTDNDRYAVHKYLTGVAESKDMTRGQCGGLLEWLVEEDSNGEYALRPEAAAEAKAIYRAAIRGQGQQEMPLKAPDMEQAETVPF